MSFMSDAMLNAAKVRVMVRAKGFRLNWLIQQMGLSRSAGYMMLREGLLPKDETVKNTALEKLAEILGVEVSDLLLRLRTKRMA